MPVPILTADLILVLLEKFVVPELARWIQGRLAAGQPITEADLLAKLRADADAGIATGLAWLAEHPEPEAPGE
jgi:hypothetical protein